ncbi:MAG: hypothetical protein NC115_09490 [Bacteroidales bacterium]|nr:hypothetical protein [Bacteroidales bacterium]
MKNRVYIIAAAAVIAFCALAGQHDAVSGTGFSSAAESIESLCKDGTAEDRYTDYNEAFICCSTSGISSARTQTVNALPRHTVTFKRNAAAKDANFKSGKSLGLNSVYNFHSQLGLFPSGLNSRSHSFIRMCRLTI